MRRKASCATEDDSPRQQSVMAVPSHCVASKRVFREISIPIERRSRNQLIVNAEMVMTGSNSNSALYRGDLLENSATATIGAAMKWPSQCSKRLPCSNPYAIRSELDSALTDSRERRSQSVKCSDLSGRFRVTRVQSQNGGFLMRLNAN